MYRLRHRLIVLGLAAGFLAVNGAALAQSSLGIGTNEAMLPSTGLFAGFLNWVNTQQQDFYRALTGALKTMKQDGSGTWLLVGLSFAYGVFHAAGPGHGKAVISSYMLANEVALRRGVLLSLLSALLQGITAAAGGSSAATNLAGAGFVAGSGAQAGNLTGDMAYGRWFKVPARWQFWTQLLTILPCALVSAWVFQKIQAARPLVLEGPGHPAPVAKMWAATALIFDGSTSMPPGAMSAMLVAGAIGVVYVLLENRPSLERWMPSSIGIGIGLVLPVAYDFAFFLGGVLLWVVLGRWLKVRGITLTTIAVGCIVAEGLGGVLKPVLHMLHLIPG